MRCSWPGCTPPISSTGLTRQWIPPCPRAERGELTGASPVDRGRPGSKHHLLVDGAGIPLVVAVSAANRHNLGLLLPLVRTVPPVRGKRGRPRQRPDCIVADRGYDSRAHSEALRVLGIRPLLAARGSPHGSGLGVWRWPVERSFAWLHWYRRLRIRWEYRADIHHALLKLACSLICYRALTRSF